MTSYLPIECKCCHADAQYLGSLDFNKSCIDRIDGRIFPVSPVQVPYWFCERCGFTFTNHMDAWSAEDFQREIYNEDYHLVDPPIYGWSDAPAKETPAYRAGQFISTLLEGSQDRIRVLDFGSGGNPGLTGQAVKDGGFEVISYDAYRADCSMEPEGQFEFIIAIEVFEHCHDFAALTQFMERHLSERGMLWISTMLHPHPVQPDALDSWYIAPRNGHISIFSFLSLAVLFRSVGINVVQTLHGLVGFKNSPDFPNHIFV